MKKFVASLLAVLSLVLLLPCCAEESALRGYDSSSGYVYLTLGQYPQTAEGEVQPILWRVLRIEDEQAYMVSEYVLFAHQLHHDDKEYISFGGEFRKTDLWAVLNGAFSEEAFSEEELSLIVDTEEFGRIFLLSREDLQDNSIGIGNQDTRRAWGTEYALNNIAPYPLASAKLYQFQRKYGGHAAYWTRSQSKTSNYAANCTKDGGQIGWIRVVVANEGVRPACYLDLTAAQVVGGSGTLEDPYQIGMKGAE